MSNRAARRATVAALFSLLTIGLPLVVAPPASASTVNEVLHVDPRDPDGSTSTSILEAGKTYRFVASGTFAWLKGGLSGVPQTNNARADAECTTLPPDTTWQRFRPFDPTGDWADLYVNDANVDWVAQSPDAFGCDPGHTYTLSFTAEETGPVSFRVYEQNNGYLDNSPDPIRVLITEDAAALDEFDVYSNSRNGSWSSVSLLTTKRYRIEATGTFTPGVTGWVADAECIAIAGTPGQRFDVTDKLANGTDLHVNRSEVDWVPDNGLGVGCDDEGHRYTLDFTPAADGPVNIRVNDAFHGDNQGVIHIRISELPGAPTSGDVPTPEDLTTTQTVNVDSSDADGSNTLFPLLAGDTYLFEVKGTYTYGDGQAQADAECSQASSDPTWIRDRYNAYVPGGDPLDVLVNTKPIEWEPITADTAGCNTTDHTYRYSFVPDSTGPVNFRVSDGNVRDNVGVLEITISRTSGGSSVTPVDEFTVFANSPVGGTSNVLLSPDKLYRLEATGEYTVGVTGVSADVECLRVPGTAGTRADALDKLGQHVDVVVQGEEVDWVAANTTGSAGCDDDTFTYTHDFEPTSLSRVTLKVNDSNYGDNKGVVTVRIFEVTQPTPSLLPVVALVETVEVDSRRSGGASTLLPLQAGESYVIEAKGTYLWGPGFADAECSATYLDDTYQPHRFASLGVDALDLLVQQATVDWVPTRPNPDGCNTADHTYRILYQPEGTGTVNFRVFDGNHADNSGVLTVNVFHIEPVS